MFTLDDTIPKDKPDILDISPIFKDTALKDVLEYHKQHGISNDILFNFYIMKNSKLLRGTYPENREADHGDYIVNLHDQQILIYDKEYNATYRIVIYLNSLYVLSLINRINDLEGSYERDINRNKR